MWCYYSSFASLVIPEVTPAPLSPPDDAIKEFIDKVIDQHDLRYLREKGRCNDSSGTCTKEEGEEEGKI